MTHWLICAAVPLGILSTAVVFGSDVFFLTIGLINGRELQASWDRLLLIRVPLLLVSLLAQSLVLLVGQGIVAG